MSPLEQALYDQFGHSEHPSGADDPNAHASEAGRCPRQISYRIRQAPITDPESLGARISWKVGQILHEQAQAALAVLHPDLQTEVAWTRGVVSGHADGLYTNSQGERVVVELKTLHPMAFKYARAPKDEHLLQANLSALALDAAAIHVIYLNKAAPGGDASVIQWITGADRASAARELGRLTAIVEATARGEVLPREYDGGTIRDPAMMTWPCSYCSYRTRCIADGEGQP